MLEQLILETKDRHSKQPISQEAYNKWRNSKVTRRLFEEIELSVLDDATTPIDTYADVGVIAITAAERQASAEMTYMVINWSPAGVEGPNDED